MLHFFPVFFWFFSRSLPSQSINHNCIKTETNVRKKNNRINNSSIFILIIYNQKLFTGTRINFPVCICFVFDAPVSNWCFVPPQRHTFWLNANKRKRTNKHTCAIPRWGRESAHFHNLLIFSYLPLHFSSVSRIVPGVSCATRNAFVLPSIYFVTIHTIFTK